jgi:hypothetical protein
VIEGKNHLSPGSEFEKLKLSESIKSILTLNDRDLSSMALEELG